MRASDVLVFLMVTLASSVAIGACSLVVDTNGLSGSAAEAGSEAGTTPESGPTTDASAPDASAPDASVEDGGFDCDGGTRLTSFQTFKPNGMVTISGSTITASVSTTAAGAQFAAFAHGDLETVPRRLLVTYDLVLTQSNAVYLEPGCSLFLQNATQTILRQVFGTDQSTFTNYLNIELLDGGQDRRKAAFAALPSGESTRHVEVLFTTTGATVAANVTVGGMLHSESLVLPDAPSQIFIRCGIGYGEQTSPGAQTTTVTINNLAISLCP